MYNLNEYAFLVGDPRRMRPYAEVIARTVRPGSRLRAMFSDSDYVWSWETDGPARLAGAGGFRQCTFRGIAIH